MTVSILKRNPRVCVTGMCLLETVMQRKSGCLVAGWFLELDVAFSFFEISYF